MERTSLVVLSLAFLAITPSACEGDRVCALGDKTYPLGTFRVPGDCNTCMCMADGQVACTLVGCPTCALDAEYRYGQTGGLVAWEDEATLTPDSGYQLTRHRYGGQESDTACSPALPACLTLDRIDVADIMNDIQAPDVQTALAASSPPLYGVDPRPVDGTVFSFRRADGRGFLAGWACDRPILPGATCVPVPEGVARLVADLTALDEQQRADASCADLR